MIEVEHDDRLLVFPDIYEENIRNLIIEIGMVFMEEIPEIRESVTLRSDTLNTGPMSRNSTNKNEIICKL